MDAVDLWTNTLFSETKDIGDAMAIAWVIRNRMEKQGKSLEEVVYAPHQFSGVGTKEWKKAESGKLTPEEKVIRDEMKSMVQGMIMGGVSDPTGGATNYFNPKLVKPSWAKNMKKMYNTDYHEYYKE